MRAQIHSRKHYVQVSLETVLAGAKVQHSIAKSDVSPSGANEVQDGSSVKAVFVEMWARTGDTAPGTCLITLLKLPGGLGSPTFANMVALDSYENKKNILYHTQGLTNDQDSSATPFVRQWFKIPKGKQRMGLGDKLVLVISAQALDQHICGFMTYKEYT